MPISHPLIRKGQQRKNAKKASSYPQNMQLNDAQSSYQEFQVNNGELISTEITATFETVISAAGNAARTGSCCRSKEDLMSQKKYTPEEADAYIAAYNAYGYSEQIQRTKRTRAAAQKQAIRQYACPSMEILISRYKSEGAHIYIESYREAYGRRWGKQNVPELPVIELPIEFTANTLGCESTLLPKLSENVDLSFIKNLDMTDDEFFSDTLSLLLEEDTQTVDQSDTQSIESAKEMGFILEVETPQAIQANARMTAAFSSSEYRSVENIDEIQLRGAPLATVNAFEFDDNCWNVLLQSKGVYFNAIANTGACQASETLTVDAEQELATSRVLALK
ncbi:hypothetical protein [Candidatus Berkiella aquae]|uniref:Uncharacterized protein n=1 Tax=Candidatus Berkiella aquae TaxID=295108 RepID=A0A0Q9YQ10_9GAMM|nr:hypothetical protein [Candidatus Berkiella aquae]MCS5710823.1 hypothetical protein [Candidatus Berkiella aquae]